MNASGHVIAGNVPELALDRTARMVHSQTRQFRTGYFFFAQNIVGNPNILHSTTLLWMFHHDHSQKTSGLFFLVLQSAFIRVALI